MVTSFLYTRSHNPIERPYEAFQTMVGISSRYQFAVRGEGSTYNRLRTCWCLQCTRELMAGTVAWGSQTRIVQGCTATLAQNESISSSSQPYEFALGKCRKIAGPGLAQRIKRDSRTRNNVAAEVTIGQWVLFEHMTDAGNLMLWLGRIMSNPAWGGEGKRQNKSRKYESYYAGNLKIGFKEVALNVMWYETIGIGEDDLDYQLSRTDTCPVVQSNKYLIPIEVQMHRLIGRINTVPKLRMSARQGGGTNASYQTSFEEWHDIEFGLKWRMDKEFRDTALFLCNV